jgi:hypothetical protein
MAGTGVRADRASDLRVTCGRGAQLARALLGRAPAGAADARTRGRRAGGLWHQAAAGRAVCWAPTAPRPLRTENKGTRTLGDIARHYQAPPPRPRRCRGCSTRAGWDRDAQSAYRGTWLMTRVRWTRSATPPNQGRLPDGFAVRHVRRWRWARPGQRPPRRSPTPSAGRYASTRRGLRSRSTITNAVPARRTAGVRQAQPRGRALR